MPLQPMSFQPDNLGQMMLEGLKTGQGLVQGGLSAQQQYLANAINQRYGMPQAGANLKKTQLENQYYGPKTEAEMHLQNAQAGLYGWQAQVEAYKYHHPYLLGSNEMQSALAFAEPGQHGGGTANQPMPGQGGTGAYGQDNWVPNVPGQDSFTGWKPPEQPQNPQIAALQNIMQQRNGSLQIPAGSMDVLKPEALQQALQQMPQQQSAAQSQPQSQGQGFAGMSQQGIADMYLRKMQSDMNYKNKMIEAIDHRLNASSYKDLPLIEKEDAVAQGKAFGDPQDVVIKELESGKTLKDIAKEHGYDPNKPETWPSKNFAATTSMLTQVERTNVANAALKSISPFVTKGIAPYAKRIEDVSPKLLRDIVTDSNTDRASDALAAYALAKDQAMLRGRVANMPAGITFVRMMTDSSMANFRDLGLKPGTKIYEQTQRKMDEQLNRMNQAENKAAFEMPSYKAAQQQDDLSNKSDAELEKELQNLGG